MADYRGGNSIQKPDCLVPYPVQQLQEMQGDRPVQENREGRVGRMGQEEGDMTSKKLANKWAEFKRINRKRERVRVKLNRVQAEWVRVYAELLAAEEEDRHDNQR
jgi:hypothetical protein